MIAAEYRAILADLGLTQADAARLLGVDGGTARRWASTSARGRAIPPPVERFLRSRISPARALALLSLKKGAASP
jgi:hypothetical protein